MPLCMQNSYAGSKDPMYSQVQHSLKVYQFPTHRNSTCWYPLQVSSLDTLTPHPHSVKCASIYSYNFSIIKIHIISFFASQLNCLRCRVGPIGLGHFEFKPSPTEELGQKLLFQVSGHFYAACKHKSLPGTTKAKLASSLHAIHWRRGLSHKDPKVLLAAELGPQGRTLQEQFPGAPTRVQSQKQAQPGQWLRPCVSSLMVASWHWKCKSSKPTSIPHADVSLVSRCFAKEQPFRWILLRSFLTCNKWDCKKKHAKLKFYCTSINI